MDDIEAFWERAQQHADLATVRSYMGESIIAALRPPAWAFGATPEQADELVGLVLEGTKTATSSALWDYEAESEDLPDVGTLGIVVDSAGTPRALVVTTEVRTVPFDEVDEEHARAEGEGDRSLAHWRRVHEDFFTEHASHDKGFARDMPVVLERFRVLHAEPAPA
ncbi:ASCH domain-containing protein [Janibacter alittae]|uniref:ASCH domain-containing protein n=1 Tax=Janibacter alittae TaxID=3115209 RepID=A0ABZ2MGZ8_9MICO